MIPPKQQRHIDRKTDLITYLVVMSMGLVNLSGCQVLQAPDKEQPPDTVQPTEIPSLTPQAAETQIAIPTSTASPTLTATPRVVLPPEPISVQFQAADSQELTGTYYPAGKNPAPLIVLMPWARGNQRDWEEIAYWLQGRGLLERAPDYNDAWKSSDWYPERTLDVPLGVFTFNFRSCEGEDGCTAYLPGEWLQDARAALETASQLQGTDPERIMTAGASIGADGAVDSCAWFNTTALGRCQGAFALSPASLLTADFRASAESLRNQPTPAPVYCLYGLRDDASVETCGDFPEINAFDYGYVPDHGFELIQPDRNPDPLVLLQDFIQEALEGIR